MWKVKIRPYFLLSNAGSGLARTSFSRGMIWAARRSRIAWYTCVSSAVGLSAGKSAPTQQQPDSSSFFPSCTNPPFGRKLQLRVNPEQRTGRWRFRTEVADETVLGADLDMTGGAVGAIHEHRPDRRGEWIFHR